MVCSMLWSSARNSVSSGVYVSGDGGERWQFTLQDTSPIGGVWDPACAFGVDGHAYFMAIPLGDTLRVDLDATWETWSQTGQAGARMHYYRSVDGGRHWRGPVGFGGIDNENLLVDLTSGPYRGRVYVYGNTHDPLTKDKNKLWLAYSTDSGRTFLRSEPASVESAWTQYDTGTILPDRAVLSPYSLQREGMRMTYAVAASSDGGVHLSLPVTAASESPRCVGGGPPKMTADHSRGPFRGRAYLLSTQAEGDPPPERAAEDCAVMLAYSDYR